MKSTSITTLVDKIQHTGIFQEVRSHIDTEHYYSADRVIWEITFRVIAEQIRNQIGQEMKEDEMY